MITLDKVMNALFENDYQLTENNSVVFGDAHRNTQLIHVLGVKESTYLGAEQAFIMAEQLIGLLEKKSQAPLLLLVDVAGQQLTMRDEWLGMNQYFGHLLSCLECLRQQGNPIISLVYNQAVGGGFIAYGLMADTIIALPEAKLAVMWLEGIAKVTKIDLNTLEELSQTIPVFAPGVNNFHLLGGLHDVVELPKAGQALDNALKKNNKEDVRAQLGKERGGRTLAYTVINQVANSSL